MKKILIINIFGIGDVLFTTPLIHNIRKNIPDAYLGYVCNKRAHAVLRNNPEIDKIFLYERDDYYNLYQTSKVKFLKKCWTALAEIKKEKFDIVIDLSFNRFASLLMWFLGIRTRVGFDYKNRSPFLNKKIKINGYEGKPVVEYYLSLLEKLGLTVSTKKMEVFLSEEDQSWATERLKSKKVSSSDFLVGIVPGGGASWGPDAKYKRWPAKKYAELADKIVKKFSAKVVLLGDSSEKDLGEEIVGTMQHAPLNLIGQTTITQSLAFLAKCNLVVVNDGGPLHMAVAVGVKTVSLFGPVDENVYGPYPAQGHGVVTKDISCRPCYRSFRRASCDHVSCLTQIDPSQVLSEIEQIVEK